jgi:NAD(P)-dependent dehydrogenase (short-subunit alcohol dehydrogenase family)
MDNMDMEGYITVVTGATSGLGLAITQEFLAQGATVVGLGRKFDRTEGLGDKFIPFKCDVTDPEQIKAAAKFVGDKFGKVDSLVLNAGASFPGTVEHTEAANFDKVANVLLRHPVLFTSEFNALLKKSDHPSITNTASVGGFMIMDAPLYSIAKGGVVNFTRQAANALAKYGIRVNAIAPGLVRTPLMPDDRWDAAATPEGLATIPVRRIGEPWEVGKLVAFLASPRAAYISGAIVLIDGGWYTTHPRSVPSL